MNSIKNKIAIALSIYAFTAAPSFSDITVTFKEGAPKDRFIFLNEGNCAIENAKLTLDLSKSKAGLIFDVTRSGAGVEVFQPLEFVSGAPSLLSIPTVKDGENKLILDIDVLNAGKSIAFTIDIDDTLGGREITVNGSEIAGAEVLFVSKNEKATGSFNDRATSKLEIMNC